jgi:hypothetical protein
LFPPAYNRLLSLETASVHVFVPLGRMDVGGVYGGVNATVFAKQMANQLHGNPSYHMVIWKTISTSRSFSPVCRPLLLKPLSMVVISRSIFPLLFVLASSSALPNSATHASSSVTSAGRGRHRRGDIEIRNAQPKEDASYSPDWAGAVYSSAPVSSCLHLTSIH